MQHHSFKRAARWAAGLVLAQTCNPTPATAQRDFVCQVSNVTVCIPGKELGSHLAKRIDDKLYYSPAGYRNWRPATVRDYPNLKQAWVLALQNFAYAVTPAGAYLEHRDGFYRASRPGMPLKRIGNPTPFLGLPHTLPKRSGSTATPWDTLPRPPWHNGENISYMKYKFATENFGYCYFESGPWLYTSHTGGATWRRVGSFTRVSTGNGLFAVVKIVHFLDERRGFAVIQMYKPSAEYLRENDGSTRDFNSDMSLEQGFYGTRLVRTTDGGHTWERVKVDGDFHRFEYREKSVRFYQAPGQPISFYCYGTARIFESRDGGSTFTPRPIKEFDTHWDRKVTAKQQCYVDSVHFAPFRVLFFNLGIVAKKQNEAGY